MKRKLDLQHTWEFEDVIDGVPVFLRLDSKGRLLLAGGSIVGEDADYERRVELAVTRARERVQKARVKASSAMAAAKSAQKRVSATANEWLANAHKEHPEYGRDKLTQHARRLAAKARVALDKRNEITEERARLFLKRQRKARTVEK